ncbi:hypothetical protein FRC01_003844, partial [Tulasnella sp. 417]
MGRSESPNSETDPLIDDDGDGPIIRPPPPPVVLQSEDALLAELIREAESKMVNVQDDHPFMLVPPLRPSPSPSPSGSQPWTPDGDYPEQSPGRVNDDNHSEPILDVKLIKAPRSKSRKINALGRGRDRTRANGSPLVVNGD